MVDQSRVTSNFDMEILLGEGFFGEVLITFRDAGIIPSEITIAPDCTLLIRGLDELFFEENMKVGLKFNLSLLSGGKEYMSGDTELFFNFEFKPVRDSRHYVTDLMLKVSFDSFSHSGLNTLMSLMGDTPTEIAGFPVTIPELQKQIEEKLTEKLQFEYRTNLITNMVQDVQICTMPEPDLIGIYINFVMRKGPEPGNTYPERGNVNAAQNLLEESTNIGIFVPSSVYPMLTTEIKASVAKEKAPGEYEYPLYDRSNASGELKNFLFTSAEAWAAIPGFNIGDPEQLFISINTRAHSHGIDADADAWMTFRPTITDGRLGWEIPRFSTNIDVDWDDQLKLALLGAYLISIFTGFIFFPLTTALLYGVLGIAEDMLEDYLDRYALDMITDEMDNIIGAIPEAITVGKRRLDPFFETHYQVAAVFSEAKTNALGMAFLADTRHREIYPLYEDIYLKKAVRNDEGELTGLIYAVPDAGELEHPENFNRPDPQRPNEFLLTLEEIYDRLNDKSIRRNLYLTPVNVRIEHGQIKYIKFDHGIYLSPEEAGNLQQAGVLVVMGYDRIYMQHKQQFYYRAKPDRYESNNLSSLPAFKPDDD